MKEQQFTGHQHLHLVDHRNAAYQRNKGSFIPIDVIFLE